MRPQILDNEKTENQLSVRRRFNPLRLPLILFAALLFYLGVIMSIQLTQLRSLEKNITQVEAELHSLKTKNQELWKKVKLLQSDAYMESLARKELGLVKPGEIPVIKTQTPTEQPYSTKTQ